MKIIEHFFVIPVEGRIPNGSPSSFRKGINKFPRKTRKFKVEHPPLRIASSGEGEGSRIYNRDLAGKFVNVAVEEILSFNKLTRSFTQSLSLAVTSLNERKILFHFGHRSGWTMRYPSTESERGRERGIPRSTTYASRRTTCSQKFRRAALPSVERALAAAPAFRPMEYALHRLGDAYLQLRAFSLGLICNILERSNHGAASFPNSPSRWADVLVLATYPACNI